ncbi:hypothetical protein [Ottowia caeni]|uniref:hypothetical protein n=1 Tax=Ottowia caeni TaxID=2870339 RepID=UPI001E50DACE|nr:hypothetical protein [Ottowia caeni]
MNTRFLCSDNAHPFGESATHPIRPPSGTLAALLVLAGTSLRRPHPGRAQPSQRLGMFEPSEGAQAPSEPRLKPLPAHPMTTSSGASNCRI